MALYFVKYFRVHRELKSKMPNRQGSSYVVLDLGALTAVDVPWKLERSNRIVHCWGLDHFLLLYFGDAVN